MTGSAAPLPRVVVAGLGPGDPSSCTPAALAALAAAPRAFVTAGAGEAVAAALGLAYPVAGAAGAAGAGLGAVRVAYERETHPVPQAAEWLVAAALDAGEVALGVPGSPLVLEPVVGLLRADPRVELVVVSGVSFCDLAWARLGIDPFAAGARLVAAGDLAALGPTAAGGPLLVAGDRGAGDRGASAGWAPLPGDTWPQRVVLLHRLGLAGERVEEVPLADAVGAATVDDVTSFYVPLEAGAAAHAGAGSELARVADLVQTLRARCPWDREQTHRSLVRHLLEEAYEAIEAIEALSVPPTPDEASHLEEELGDLLCQVYFHATLAAETGFFDLAGVARALRTKLVARHPHVFGDRIADDARWVVANWERGKLTEKGRTSLMDGIPAATPALAATAKVERKATGAGLGIDVTGEAAGLPALLETLLGDAIGVADAGDLVGDLLFGIARLASHAGHDPEAAVRGAIARFRRRFAAAEQESAAAGSALHDLAAAERLQLWHRC